MTKNELITAVANSACTTKKNTEDIINAFIDVVENEVSLGEKVQIVNFGIFEATKKNERIGRNPQTGETIVIKDHRIPRFKPGKQFKEKVNQY